MTRNADITVDEGMMDHDIDFRDVMSELLKKRRKLAAVRLQFWPEAPQEIAKFLREKLVVPSSRLLCADFAAGHRLPVKLASRIGNDGEHAEMFYPAAKPMQAPAGYDLYTEGAQARRVAGLPVPEHSPLYPDVASRRCRPQRGFPSK